MIKVLIDTEAVARLIEGDPKIEAQLKEVAAEKVAEQLKRKLTDHAIKTSVDSAVDRAIGEHLGSKGRWGSTINTQLKAEIQKLAIEAVAGAVRGAKHDLEKLTKEAVSASNIQIEFDEAMARYKAQLSKELAPFVGELAQKAVQERVNALMKAVG